MAGLGDRVAFSIIIPLGIVWFHVGCPFLNCITMSNWLSENCDLNQVLFFVLLIACHSPELDVFVVFATEYYCSRLLLIVLRV